MANKLETTQVTFNDEKITCARFTIDDISVPFVLKNIAVTGKYYTFSLYLKSNSASSISVEGNNITSTTAWTRQYVIFSATKANVEISFNKTGTYYFYNTQLETGKICSDWTPNPEDISEDVLNAETIAKQTATKFSWLVKSGTNESNFEITDRVINLISKNINLDGIVTFINTAKGEVYKNLYTSTGYADFESIKSTDEAICYAKLDSNSVAIDSSTYWQGSNSLKISGTEKDRVRVYLGNKENNYGCIKVEQGKTYQITAYVKSDSEQNVSFGIDLITHGTKIDAATGTCYIESYLFNPQKPSIPKGCTTITPNTSWQRAITTFTVTDKTNSYYYISIVPTIYNQLSKNANFWVDGIMVEEVESLNSEPNEFTNSAKATIIDGNSILTDSITADKLTANSITAEKIMADALKSKNYVVGESGSFLNLADGSFDSKYLKWDNAGKVIANDITVVGGSINVNDKFIVNNDGIATLQGATVVGNITAESGKIGKFNLDNLALVTGDTDVTCAGLGGSSQAFWAGSLIMDNAPFRVGYDGKLYASDANISGVINSTDGSIGGWKINSDRIESSTSSTDTYNGKLDCYNDTLSILSEGSRIVLSNITEKYSDSSKKNTLEKGSSSISLMGSLIKGSDRNMVYGIEENEETDYRFCLSAINGLEMYNNTSGDNTTYACNGIKFSNGVWITPDQNTLWSGADYMNENQTISLDGDNNISKQLSGICLAFTYYDRSNNSVKWYGMHYYFVPKSAVTINNGGGTAFTDAYRGINKYLYIYNDKIIGTKQNGTNGTEGGFSYDNRNWVLVRVFGV